MTAVAWGVIVALAVGVANFGLGIANWRRQSAEPTREAQRLLYAELRVIFENVTDELSGLESALRRGTPIADVSRSTIDSAHDRVLKIAPRLAKPDQVVRFLEASTAIFVVHNRIVLLPGGYVDDPSAIKESSRVRGKEDDLRQGLRNATAKVKACIDYLDDIDKGLSK